MDLQNMDLQGGSLQISTEVVGKIARCAALEVDGVLITMYTKTLHCEEVCQRVYEAFSEKVFHTFISRSIKLPDSTVAAAPVVVYAPEHKTSKEYREVARELIARGIVA